MIHIIAVARAEAYRRVMHAALWKLLAAIALVLMPFGMSGASAAPVHHAAAATATQHSGHAQHHDGQPLHSECALTCTAVAPDAAVCGEPLAPAEAPPVPAPGQTLASIQPEAATPPPRIA